MHLVLLLVGSLLAQPGPSTSPNRPDSTVTLSPREKVEVEGFRRVLTARITSFYEQTKRRMSGPTEANATAHKILDEYHRVRIEAIGRLESIKETREFAELFADIRAHTILTEDDMADELKIAIWHRLDTHFAMEKEKNKSNAKLADLMLSRLMKKLGELKTVEAMEHFASELQP